MLWGHCGNVTVWVRVWQYDTRIIFIGECCVFVVYTPSPEASKEPFETHGAGIGFQLFCREERFPNLQQVSGGLRYVDATGAII